MTEHGSERKPDRRLLASVQLPVPYEPLPASTGSSGIWASSSRELTPSLTNTLARWYSTVRRLRTSSPALLLLAPVTTSRATPELLGRQRVDCAGVTFARGLPRRAQLVTGALGHSPVPRPSNVPSAARSWIRRFDPAPVAAQALAVGEEGTGLDLVLPAGYGHSTGPQRFAHIWPPYPNTNHNWSPGGRAPNRVLRHSPRRDATTIQD